MLHVESGEPTTSSNTGLAPLFRLAIRTRESPSGINIAAIRVMSTSFAFGSRLIVDEGIIDKILLLEEVTVGSSNIETLSDEETASNFPEYVVVWRAAASRDTFARRLPELFDTEQQILFFS